MKVFVTTIEHDFEVTPEVVVTSRPLTDSEKQFIFDSIKEYKQEHKGYDGAYDLMNETVFKPFADILVEFDCAEIDALEA